MRESEGRENIPADNSPEFISSLISAAYLRIHQHLLPTRLLRDEGFQLWLKCENEQNTGSFKWRGALSKLSTLKPGQSIVTASTGNHGLGVATAAKLYNLNAKVFVPSSAAQKKIERLQRSGADIVLVDGDSLEAELAGKAFAEKNNLQWVSPYNDLDVIAGQGTIGYEIDAELPFIDKIYVTVGGGGLISGIGSWIKHFQPYAEIIGCQPANSPEMYLSTIAGHVVTAPDAKPTLSDGSAGPLEEDSITFGICQQLIDRFILISEDEIKAAIKYLYSNHGLVVEGAAGVAMAAAVKDSFGEKDTTSVVVLCGGNIDPLLHQEICRE
ncbi:MAG TPA: pyridoxal-phosphate dependent enzyme [Saprospiraceae bacterium]|nr:pyridoxal-phosphate dependent enzyme [Saprospiraceae bacterium]